ncbi:TIR domain-containing protein [Pararhizobium sp. PWRC1-1]|uniref:TIR domain-containing protein n=1 Tax=Pararhizobium sp. PWRC1-1 TaxID=2804566 RepID=UPI003CEBA6C3
MSKLHLFIGSSVENIELARAVQTSLEYDASTTVWTSAFPPSHFPLEALENSLEKADFAVFICSPDDITNIRGQELKTVRDNVIFELGLFMGRLGRKRTFLISPRGAVPHLPTDLNGIYPEDFEPALLSNPETALGPACNKIRTAMRHLGARQRPNRDLQEAEDAPKVETQPAVTAQSPSPDWRLEDYRRAIFFAMLRDDGAETLQVDAAFRASKLITSPESVAEWEAWIEIARISAGGRVDLKLLRDRADAYPENAQLKAHLGSGLSHYGDEAGAAGAYRDAAKLAKRMELAASSVIQTLEAEKNLRGLSSATTLKALLHGVPQQSHAEKLAFVEAMHAISKTAKLVEVSKAIAEVSLSVAPDDSSVRFELARAYEGDNQHHLSMLHYQSIPRDDRSGTAWNNLGVSYVNLKIPGMAIRAYEVAAQLGETIADGNLAQKLLSAGFYDESE